jgi:hypothetical protein
MNEQIKQNIFPLLIQGEMKLSDELQFVHEQTKGLKNQLIIIRILQQVTCMYAPLVLLICHD